ncbi:MAG TPA: glycosyltransferase family 39 protein [Oscillatoriaceae cyanobacterium]
MPAPTRYERHLPSLVVLLGVAVLLLIPYLLTSGFHGDEFDNLNDALRMLHGQLIYRDFFEFIAPFSFWIAEATFALAGPSVLAARLVQSAGLLLSTWQLYDLARRLEVPPWLAALPGVILLGALYRAWPGYSHHWIALPLALGALQAAMRALDGPRRWWGLSGLLAGLVTLDMQTDGPALVAVLVGTSVLDAVLRRKDRAAALKDLGALTLGCALPWGLATLYFATQGALVTTLKLVWLWPLHHYKQAGGFNDVRYGSDWWGEIRPIARSPLWLGRAFHLSGTYLLAPVAAIAGLSWFARSLIRRAWSDTSARWALVILWAIANFALVVHGRADYPRIAIYAVPSVLVLCAFAGRALSRRAAWKWFPTALLVTYAGTGLFLLSRYMAADPATWCRLASPDQRIASLPVLSYLRAHTEPSDRLVVFPNGGLFYFYGRPAATRYTVIYPIGYRYMDPREIHEVWHEIAQSKPKYMVVGPYVFNGTNLESLMPGGAPSGYQRIDRRFEMDGHPVWLFKRMATQGVSAVQPSS